MKSIIRQSLVVIFFTLLFAGNFAAAQGIKNPINVDTIQELLTAFLTILIDIAVIVAVIFVILSGLKMVMARGNPEEIKNAKNMLMYTLIGAAIAIGAKSIQLVIENTVNELKK